MGTQVDKLLGYCIVWQKWIVKIGKLIINLHSTLHGLWEKWRKRVEQRYLLITNLGKPYSRFEIKKK